MTSASSKSDAIFRVLIANSFNGIVVIDAHGKILIFNAACERLFGYMAEEVVSHDVNMLMPAPYFDEYGEYLARHQTRTERLVLGIGRDVIGRRKDGSPFPMYLSVGEGKLDEEKMYIGVIHDLTPYRAAEAALREGEARLSSILETAPDAMVTFNLEGLIESFSSAATKLFGYAPAEVIGKNIKLLIPLLRYMASGEKSFIGSVSILVGVRQDGTRFPMEISVGQVWLGQALLFTGFVHDITERQAAKIRFQELQFEFLHVSRLNAMAHLASTLAHELNQPLAAIGNYIKAARRTLASTEHPQTARVQALMDKASKQTSRASEIIRRQRDFIERRQRVRSDENLKDVIEEAIDLSVIGSLGVNVEIETTFDPLLPKISIDRVQIQQVLVNLIRNAVESMQATPVRILKITTAAYSDQFVQVSVADTGAGLSKDVVGRLFKSLLTTKANGMGVGLSICKAIIEAHGGEISATPNEGNGVTFRFRLPRVSSEDSTLCVGGKASPSYSPR